MPVTFLNGLSKRLANLPRHRVSNFFDLCPNGQSCPVKFTTMWNTNQDGTEDLIRSVYATTSEVERGLRDVVVSTILQVRKMDHKFNCKTSKFIRSLPELAMDLATCFLSTDMNDRSLLCECPTALLQRCGDPESHDCPDHHMVARAQTLASRDENASPPRSRHDLIPSLL